MAKEKGAKKETKSDFLRKVLGKKPLIEHHQVNHLWAKAGHAGEISSALFYQVRAKMGIKIEWQWVRMPEPEPKSTLIPRSARGSAARPSRPPTAVVRGTVYQFKVTLQDIEPPVWRRIQ